MDVNNDNDVPYDNSDTYFNLSNLGDMMIGAIFSCFFFYLVGFYSGYRIRDAADAILFEDKKQKEEE